MTATAMIKAGWSTHRGLVILAVGYQWFYNGANFLAFKVAGNVLHPLVVATLRFSVAALILLPFALARWRRTPASVRELGGAALIGVTMLVASQALAIWGTHFLPAGVASVFGSSAPLFLALFAWGVFRQPLTQRQLAGVAIGFVGLAVMGWSSATGEDFDAIGAVLMLTAAAAWATGSLLSPRLALPRDPVIGLAVQLVAAGLVLSAIVTVSGIAATTHLARIPLAAWGALSFLIVASTLIGYAVFLALNAQVSPTLANTFNYAAPVVALCLSALVLHEPLTLVKVLSGGIALMGVALMIERKRPDERLQSTGSRHRNKRADHAGAGLSDTLASRTFKTPRHTTHYLECGPSDGPLIIFLHGWPELSLIWRAQMNAFAAEGWHCVAPDLRGYGGSSAPAANDAYSNEQVVADLAELHEHLGGKPAIWVGHDWGSVVAGSLVAHEPKRSRGVVLVSVPYFPSANALPTLVPLVDRTIYPAGPYPDGQWDYYRYYTTHFEAAVADLDADKAASLASIFRRGDPASVGKASPNATVTRQGGRFGGAHRAPPTQPDPALWPTEDFDVLVRTFEAHGFHAPCAWYLNDDANIGYARRAPNGGRISQPVLFVNGDFDQINTINGNHLGDPMREACADLTVTSLPGAHWLPVECKAELIQIIRSWLEAKKL